MKVLTACLSLGIGLGVAALPANAADMGYGGYRDNGISDYQGGEAVPVPAPVPVPQYNPSWYFRFDAGLGVISDPSISASIDGLTDNPGAAPGETYSADSSWFSSDFDTFLTLGGGFGYYFGNGWRMDATVEKRSKDDVSISGEDVWDAYGCTNCGNYAVIDADLNGNADTRTRFDFQNNTKLEGTVWMANMYYDLGTRRGFTPYIGAGLGFVWNQITQSSSATLQSCDNEDPAGCDAGNFGAHGDFPNRMTGSDKADKISLAAAAMAGFSYDISEITAVDIGYRYMFLQGTDAVLSVGDLTSRVEIEDQHVHQVRAGLRFNVN